MSKTPNTLDTIKQATYPILIVPFHGTPISVTIRELTFVQTVACGEFSLIESAINKLKNNKLKRKDMISYSKQQHKIAKEALINPTYDQILKEIGDNKLIDIRRKELEELKIKLRNVKPGGMRARLEEEIDSMSIWINLILPNDFLSYVCGYALQINKTDIKKLSDKILLDAAIIADRGHKSTSDIICADGVYTAFNKFDIDRRAMYLLYQYRERKK